MFKLHEPNNDNSYRISRSKFLDQHRIQINQHQKKYSTQEIWSYLNLLYKKTADRSGIESFIEGVQWLSSSTPLYPSDISPKMGENKTTIRISNRS